MAEQIRISGKNLGAVGLADFCPRCFWIKLRTGDKLPWQKFPGIFSSIDAYTKHVVHGWVDRSGKFPSWLDALGPLVRYENPPHHSKFQVVVPGVDILLTGAPDAVFVRQDSSYLIADYKTAKHTGTQDELLPMYHLQLNSYALIGKTCGISPVSRLTLIYMEPATKESDAANKSNERPDGFAMGFSAHIEEIDIDEDSVHRALKTTREIHNLSAPPASRVGCQDCGKLDHVITLLRQDG